MVGTARMDESKPEANEADAWEVSSVRTPRKPVLPRKVWIVGSGGERLAKATAVLEQAGHAVRSAETSAELAPTLREFRPDLIVVDMQEQPDRGRHIVAQLRADRATRQLPIILTGARGVDMTAGEKQITGPTRRYTMSLDAPSVLNAIVAEL
jgi:CheY-like chemotaxis protein